MAATPATIVSAGAKLRANQNGPDHRLQLNQHLLYERDFYGDTFVSAHLQRLQNGVFTDKNIHKEDTLHVTFAAVTFIFHPSNSDSHRFKSAVITIKATNHTGEPLRFLKYAPHVAYGRISSANLKWNFQVNANGLTEDNSNRFQLGASLGVTNGLVDANIKPSMGFEKDAMVGSFMKMQGSTRCAPTTKDSPSRKQDTMLVWSLEENSQQEGGIPSEFTFVFLLERPHPFPNHVRKDDDTRSFESGTTLSEAKDALVADGFNQESLAATPRGSHSPENSVINQLTLLSSETKKQEISISSLLKSATSTFNYPHKGVFSPMKNPHDGKEASEEVEPPEKHRVCSFLLQHRHHDGTTSTSPIAEDNQIVADHVATSALEHQSISIEAMQAIGDLGQDGIHEIKDKLQDEVMSQLPQDIREKLDPQPFEYSEDLTIAQPLHDDYSLIFTPIRISISVKPRITNAPDKATNVFAQEFEEAIIEGQVGQKFPTNLYDPILTPHTALKYQNVMVDGLFNFAQMPGNFEDMIELPGNAVTTVEPAFPSAVK